MLNLGDRVKHQVTGNIGIVVGLGKRIVNNKCLPTAKVKIVSPQSNRKTTVKDLNTKWRPCPQDLRTIYPNPLHKNVVLKPAAKQIFLKTA